MRIVYDYGLGVKVPRPAPQPAGKGGAAAGGGREPIMVIRRGAGIKASREPGDDAAGGPPAGRPRAADGIRIPGTDLALTVSDAARGRDAEVRLHERAHLTALGGLAASGVNLVMRRGPDGESYAVGGSVKVDLSPVPGDPDATLRKAQNLIRAAMAPGDPSAGDMKAAAEAYRMAAKAKEDLHQIDLSA